jgi:antitoxin MazE
MKAQVAKWGNSLAVRIPKAVATKARFRRGDPIELRVSRPGAVEIHSRKSKPKLARLVRGITPQNRHRETDWGTPRGNELW